MAAKSVVMVDARVDEKRRNVQNFVLVVTTTATIVKRDFILFLL